MNNIPEEIKDYLSYDELTGDLTWIKKPSNKSNINTIANSRKKGYIRIMFKGVNYSAHRLAWFLKTNNQPPNQIDHIDTIKSNNIWTNLREATNSENKCNTPKYRSNTSGYKGVYYHKSIGKFHARISINNKRISLGTYDTAIDAHTAYCMAADLYHNQFKHYG